MTTARIRPLLAATAVAAVLSFGLAGHGMPPMSNDDMAGAAAGLCLLVVTALGYAAARKPDPPHPAVVTDTAPTYAGPPRPPLYDRARASPSALQRFRN